MIDIVERLRRAKRPAISYKELERVLDEAADEIKRLRAEVEALRDALDGGLEQWRAKLASARSDHMADLEAIQKMVREAPPKHLGLADEKCPVCGGPIETLFNQDGRNPLRCCWRCELEQVHDADIGAENSPSNS
jgi:DNA repair exonuclease SbcCD ATPase subunit